LVEEKLSEAGKKYIDTAVGSRTFDACADGENCEKPSMNRVPTDRLAMLPAPYGHPATLRELRLWRKRRWLSGPGQFNTQALPRPPQTRAASFKRLYPN
jgi:hypothetical protein